MRSPTTNPKERLRTAKSYEKTIQGWLGPARHNAPRGQGKNGDPQIH